MNGADGATTQQTIHCSNAAWFIIIFTFVLNNVDKNQPRVFEQKTGCISPHLIFDF
jgi:hypothetical protein